MINNEIAIIMRKTLIIFAAIAFSSLAAFAQNKITYGVANHVAVSAGIGTQGITAEVGTCMSPYVALRAGVDIMPSVKPSYDVDFTYSYVQDGQRVFPDGKMTSTITGNTGRVSGHIMADIYPFTQNKTFFVTVGASFGGASLLTLEGYSAGIENLYKGNPNADVLVYPDEDNPNSYSLTVDSEGKTYADLSVSGFRPYLGLGFGRFIPRSRVGIRCELGLQFHGTPKIMNNGEDILDKLSNDVTNSDVSDALDIAKKVVVYPCLKFGLTFRAL